MIPAFQQRWWMIALIILVTGVACIVAMSTPLLLSSRDLFSYWAGARLLLEGRNPYDLEGHISYWYAFASLREVFTPAPLYTPPYVFTLLLPLALIPSYKIALILSVALSISLYLTIFLQLIDANQLRKKHIVKAVLFFLTFPPLLLVCITGQILLIPFLGLVGWLLFSQSRPTIAGVAAALTLCKPHIFFPLYLIQLLARPSARFIFAGVMAAFILVLLPVAIRVNVYGEFLGGIAAGSSSWITPTLGAFIQGWFNSEQAALRFIPLGVTCLTILIGGCFSWRIEFLRYGIPVALIAAPYLWSYDFIFLLPTIALILNESWERPELKWVVWVLLGMNVLLLISTTPNYLSVWYPVGVLGVSLTLKLFKKSLP